MLAPYQPPQSAKGNNFSWPQGGTLGRDECRDAYIREALGLQSAVPVRPTIVSQSFILPTALSGRAYNQEEAAMPRDRQSFGVGDRPRRRGFLGAAIGGCVWCELSRRSLGQQPAHGPSGGTSPPHWSYEGEAGAGHWGELSADFKSCEFGVQQSPIDLADPVTAQLGGLDIAYHDMRLRIINNGHTIQVNADPGSLCVIGGTTYELLQFHFHHPSEHLLSGKAFDLECHLVHRSAAGDLAVIGVFIKPGAANPSLGPIWNAMPLQEGLEKDAGTRDQSRLAAASRKRLLSLHGLTHHAAMLGRRHMVGVALGGRSVARSDPPVCDIVRE